MTFSFPNNYILLDYCQLIQESQSEDSLTEDFKNLTTSSENLPIDNSLPKEFSYSTNIISSTFISTFISSSDSSSYLDNSINTDSSLLLNISNSSLNYTSMNDYNNISDYSNFINDTNISNFNHSFNDKNISNYTNSYNDINISNHNNSLMNKGQQILNNEITIDKNEIINYIQEIIGAIEIGKNYEIKGEDYSLIIRPINASYSSNSTHINFNECEKILRNTLNISSSRIITFLQMEINNKDKSLVNQVEYQVYDNNKNLLDLSLCKDLDIEITYAMKDKSLDIKSISELNNKGIDVFNINDSFFNDICHPYSDSNNDIVLEDRIKDIYQNYSLCYDDCSYNGFDLMNKTISCDCKVKTNMSLNESSITLKRFDEIKIESNFGLIKCYKLVFSFDGKIKNIGFWIFLFFVS